MLSRPAVSPRRSSSMDASKSKLGFRDLRAHRSRDLISQRYKSVGSSVPCDGTNQIYWNCWAHDTLPALLQTNSTAGQTRICYILVLEISHTQIGRASCRERV